MTNFNPRTLVYLAYGRDEIFEQTLFSVLSLMYHCGPGLENSRVAVYTDEPERFAALPVKTIKLTSVQLNEWLGGSDYIHRRKTCVIIDALDRFGGKVAFIDSDTWFRASPARIFNRVGQGRACFHICEGFISATGTPFDKALVRQLEIVPLSLRSGEQVRVKGVRMWNTGVVAIDVADRELMVEALALSDAIWHTADPLGAYGKKIHHAEQFATGYAFRDCRLSEAADCVYHYWPSEAKQSFGARLPQLVKSGVIDQSLSTLARIYAERYRERGFRAWIDAIKMQVRAAALTLGINARGARRSVRG